MPEKLLYEALEGAKKAGIDNIVALRGDPPKGAEAWTVAEGGLACALDLVKVIRAKYGDHFNISVAGYPEGHPNVIKKVEAGAALTDSESRRMITLEDGDWVCYDADYKAELAYLKQKVDAGADMIITQMFFDVDVYLQFVRDCREIGISVPILPGIMLVQAYAGFKRMVAFAKTRVPKYILAEVCLMGALAAPPLGHLLLGLWAALLLWATFSWRHSALTPPTPPHCKRCRWRR